MPNDPDWKDLLWPLGAGLASITAFFALRQQAGIPFASGAAFVLLALGCFYYARRAKGNVLRKPIRLLAVLLLVPVVVLAGLGVSHQVSRVTINDEVTCADHQPIIGIWVHVPSSGSGFVGTWSPGDGSSVPFSHTLPHSEQYAVHLGCGGTPQNWLYKPKSNLVSGSGLHFFCDTNRLALEGDPNDAHSCYLVQ
jgi:hypothetical protein